MAIATCRFAFVILNALFLFEARVVRDDAIGEKRHEAGMTHAERVQVREDQALQEKRLDADMVFAAGEQVRDQALDEKRQEADMELAEEEQVRGQVLNEKRKEADMLLAEGEQTRDGALQMKRSRKSKTPTRRAPAIEKIQKLKSRLRNTTTSADSNMPYQKMTSRINI